MPWQPLGGETAKITIYLNGQIEWNDYTHQMLNAPVSVAIFHDADGNRLGFRKITPDTLNCLRVLFNEDLDYMIDAAVLLENAGLSFDESFTATLQPPAPFVPPSNPGDSGIWWIALPE